MPATAGVLFVAMRTYISFEAAIFVFIPLIAIIFLLSEKRGKQMLSFVLTLSVCLLLGTYFFVYRSHEEPIYGIKTDIECKIHSVHHTLDGTYKVRAYSYEFGFLEFKLSEGYIPVSGEQVRIRGSFYEPYTPRNPGQFDQSQYMKRRGVEYAFTSERVFSLKDASILNRCLSKAENCLYGLRSRIMLLYGEDAPLAASIFLGDSSLTEDNVRALYKRNGCSHLLAVSGTHFAGFLALVTYFLNKGQKSKVGILLYIIFCILLASFTGWSSSVTRACIMCCASYCSKDSLSGLCIASIVMTLADPYNALSYGFMMTCCASLGIMYMTPFIRKITDKRLGNGLSGMTAPVLASQIGMLPFIAVTSQKFGVIPLVVQIISSFIASLACTFFIPSVILAILLVQDLIFPSKLLLDLLNMFVIFSDKYYLGFSISGIFSVAVITALFAVIFKKSFISRYMRIHIACFLIFSLMVGVLNVISAPDARVIFIDVGQGDSCLISASGKSVLVDGGTYEAGKDDVVSVLEHYDVRHIDIAIATHWDRDHIGGLLYLYDIGMIDKIYTPCVDIGIKQQEILCEYLPDIDPENVFVKLSGNDRISFSEDCRIDVLYPASDVPHTGENEDSLVMKFTCFDITVLLTGDLGIEQEEKLLDTESIGKIDILKAGHHGSEFSTGYELLAETEPEIAIISAGVNNQYGHPSKVTLGRLEYYGVTVISTQDSGAITILINKGKYEIFGFLRNHDILS